MSVSWGTQYAKLKTNLRLAANRLRLLQKKKTEQAMKARTEIADFLSSEKEDRARIRVESIIREDFVVEAYELLEMFCELLLARFGLIQQMKELDDGIAEAVSSLLWVAPRISHEVAEFKVINDQLQQKYGKPFAEAARMNQLPEPSRVSSKLVQKLSVSAPSKLLVEKWELMNKRRDSPKVMRDDDDEIAVAERNLINFMNEDQIGWSLTGTRHPPAGGPGNYGPPPQDVGGNGQYPGGGGGNYGPPPPNVGGNGQHPGGGGGMQSYPQYPQMSQFTVPGVSTNLGGDAGPSPAAGPMLNMPNEEAPYLPPAALSSSSAQPSQNLSYQPSKQQSSQQYPAVNVPTSSYNSNVPMGDPNASVNHKTSEVPLSVLDDYLSQFPAPPKELPPRRGSGGGGHGGNVTSKPSASDNLDFDDLARRFKELKKRL